MTRFFFKRTSKIPVFMKAIMPAIVWWVV